jgi:hypothetical protein
VGTFVPDPTQPGTSAHVVVLAKSFTKADVNFDLDMVVVTQSGKTPLTDIVATGARTLFEEMFFRARAGLPLDPVIGTRANFIETNDPLVQLGAQLFVKETFNGNGRICATCHPLANNQTIDARFVAALPKTDPLFHFPAGEDDPTLLAHGLIHENVDGFEDPTHKFVGRGVPHTLSLATSRGVVGTAAGHTADGDGPPPDERLGWSGDGAPGRGTLNEFAFGAIVQHDTLTLARVPGKDFRIPTQEELNALEAFQLFNGRQKGIDSSKLGFGDPAATRGQTLAFDAQTGDCFACHADLNGAVPVNENIDTQIEGLPPASFRTAKNMPRDGGFGVVDSGGTPGTIAIGFGNGDFNIPPLIEAADTSPFFHDNAFTSTIEDAISFYQTTTFAGSPGAGLCPVSITDAQRTDIGSFLRTLNALFNMMQVRNRAVYLQNNATAGGTTIVDVAIRDTQDAINDLTVPDLKAAATLTALKDLTTAKQILNNSLPLANKKPATAMAQVLQSLRDAKSKLLTANPNNDF